LGKGSFGYFEDNTFQYSTDDGDRLQTSRGLNECWKAASLTVKCSGGRQPRTCYQ
jgi:hypothetical protein